MVFIATVIDFDEKGDELMIHPDCFISAVLNPI